MTTDTNNARSQAWAQFEGIMEMVAALDNAYQNDDDETIIRAREAIEEDALEILTRSGWRAPGMSDDDTDAEYLILLCTGGPAVRIIGQLSQHCEPISARIEYQDWSTPWEEFPLTASQEKIVLEYASVFYFGD